MRIHRAGYLAICHTAIGMLTGAVIVGVNGQLWLAVLLTGPSLIALAKIFVLRRSDRTDVPQFQAPTGPPSA